MNKPLLIIKNLNVRLGEEEILQGIDLEILPGRIVALVGPNGSGKTTLLNVISGFIPDFRGEILFKDQPLRGLQPYEIALLGIVRMFQVVRIFPELKVEEHLALVLEDNTQESLRRAFLGRSDLKVLRDRIYKLLKVVGLSDKIQERALTLSHGQKRLLEMARCLAQEGYLYLFDEPTAGVFTEVRKKLKELWIALKARNRSILLVEHNLEVVREVADEVILLENGRIQFKGAPQEVSL